MTVGLVQCPVVTPISDRPLAPPTGAPFRENTFLFVQKYTDPPSSRKTNEELVYIINYMYMYVYLINKIFYQPTLQFSLIADTCNTRKNVLKITLVRVIRLFNVITM